LRVEGVGNVGGERLEVRGRRVGGGRLEERLRQVGKAKVEVEGERREPGKKNDK